MHCRITRDLKDWVTEYTTGAGKEIGELVQGVLEEYRQKATGKSPSLEEKLERRLAKVDEELGELEDEKNRANMRSRTVANILGYRVYADLRQNFPKVRLRALQDFRQSKPAWAKQFQVKSEAEIIAACRMGAKLLELRAERNDLEARLGTLYGMQETTGPPPAPGGSGASIEATSEKHTTEPRPPKVAPDSAAPATVVPGEPGAAAPKEPSKHPAPIVDIQPAIRKSLEEEEDEDSEDSDWDTDEEEDSEFGDDDESSEESW